MMVSGVMEKTGKNWESSVSIQWAAGKVQATPATPPIRAMTMDSPKTTPAMWSAPKPRVFMVAYSAIRSRAVMAMVLAATTMMMTITT